MAADLVDPTDRAIGERIRAGRHAMGLSQRDLGAELGLSFQQIQKYEHGVNRVSASMLIRISNVLAVPADRLLGLSAPGQIQGWDSADEDISAIVQAFGRIRDPALRKRLLDLIQTISTTNGQTA